MIGIVLSRTVRGSQICFSLFDVETQKQVRPVFSKYSSRNKFNLNDPDQLNVYEHIIPGTLIEYHYSDQNIKPRITHPEDTPISPFMKILGTASKEEFSHAISLLTFPRIKDLFTGIKISNGRLYVESDIPQKRSTGYVNISSLTLRVVNRMTTPKVLVDIMNDMDVICTSPLKDEHQITHFVNTIPEGEKILFEDHLTRLSIAGTYNPNNQWAKARCYLQVSRIEFQ